MNDFEKLTAQIENLINAGFRGLQDGKLTQTDLYLGCESLKRSIKMAEKLVEAFEAPLKATVEANGSTIIDNRKFYYKVTESQVFDTAKAKSKLEELEYNLGDFYKLQTRKSLTYDLISNQTTQPNL